MAIGKRLRRYLRGAALDDLPALPSSEMLRTAAAGIASGVGSTTVALMLLSVSRDGDIDLRATAADSLSRATPRWWLVLDEELRKTWWWVPQWSEETTRRLANERTDLLTLLLAGCHPNGRIRQAAVALLANHAHPAIGFVLALRAAEWVPQVREQAREAYEHLLAGSDTKAWTASAELVFALKSRAEGRWLAQQVEMTLRGLPADRLEQLLYAAGRQTHRATYRAKIDAGELTLPALATAAVKDPDLLVRVMCAMAAVAVARGDGDGVILESLLASRTALVRAEALRALSGVRLDYAEAALPDRHQLVRAIAQSALRRAGHDPAIYYRTLMATTPPGAGAIAGLGETGTISDIPALARWLAHPQPRGRVEAIRALRRLDGIRIEDLLPLLHDPSGAVTRQVTAVLRGEAWRLDPTMLAALLEPQQAAHVRLTGYRLLTATDVWQRLATNLRLVDDTYLRLRARARTDIAVWLDRQAATTYRMPSPARAGELDILLEQARSVLGDRRVALLRFHARLTRGDR